MLKIIQEMHRITILFFNRVDNTVYSIISRKLPKSFPPGFISKISCFPRGIEIPKNSFVERRAQYNASIFLQSLYKLKMEHKFDKVLGITKFDLYTNNLNFVFGCAHPIWGVAIVSLNRLKIGVALNIYYDRIVKEVVHELGHIFNLAHCIQNCVMRFSNSIFDTDEKPSEFCNKCLECLNIHIKS